jgi:hypothetical protein
MNTILGGRPDGWRQAGQRAAALVGKRAAAPPECSPEDDLRRVEEILDAAIARGLARAAVRLARAADAAVLRLVVALTQAHGPDHALTQRAHAALERAYAAQLAACAPFLAADDHPALDHVIASYGARAARREDAGDGEDAGGHGGAGEETA